MISPNELEPFLNGSQGISGLDLARDYVATCALVEALQQRCEQLTQTAISSQESAAAAFGQVDALRGQLKSTCDRLAELCAQSMEYCK
jgi:hypothetical protein